MLIAWILGTSAAIGLVYKLVLHEAEAAFNQKVFQLYETIEHTVRDNESILEGFSAFLSAIDYVNRESTTRYSQQILSRYPHIYRLEVALTVKRKDLPDFINRQRELWLAQFDVRALNYSADKLFSWEPIEKKPDYTPIIFIEPMNPEATPLIGADLDSITFLHNALVQSMYRQSSVASIPYQLINGPRGYSLIRTISEQPHKNFSKRKQAIAILEVNAEAIQKKIAALTKNLDFCLYHTSFSSNDRDGWLIRIPDSQPDSYEISLFPELSAEMLLDNTGQPLAIKINKQLGWSDLDLPLIIATVCSLLLSLILLLVFLNTHFRREQQLKNSANKLLHMATHDALTGLPNRTLLADRFGQASSRTYRREIKFAVMFLDLNGFKTVNDTHGHEIGDQLLKALGGLLKECIREEDTLCRLSGDEFVILLEDSSYKNAECVAKKIQTELSRPMVIQGTRLNIGLSLGIAIYPDDGTKMSDLLKKADERMYKAKDHHKLMTEEQA